MCFIAISKKVEGIQGFPQVEGALKEALYDKMSGNPDGFFVENANGVDPRAELRTLSINQAMVDVEAREVDNLFCHFRIATTGKIHEDNVHGWRLGHDRRHPHWQFFHNGFVSKFSSFGRTSEKTDSLQFFETLINSIKNRKRPDKVAHDIKKAADEYGFSGRAALYNEEYDDLFLFGDFQLYYINGSYMVFTSAPIDIKNSTEIYDVHGLQFEREKVNNFDIIHEVIQGVNIIRKFSTSNWKFNNLEQEMTVKRTFPAPRQNSHIHNHSRFTTHNHSVGTMGKRGQLQTFLGEACDLSGYSEDEQEDMLAEIERGRLEMIEAGVYNMDEINDKDIPAITVPAKTAEAELKSPIGFQLPEVIGTSTTIPTRLQVSKAKVVENEEEGITSLNVLLHSKSIPLLPKNHELACRCKGCNGFRRYIANLHAGINCSCEHCSMVHRNIVDIPKPVSTAAITIKTAECTCNFCIRGYPALCSIHKNEESGKVYSIEHGHIKIKVPLL